MALITPEKRISPTDGVYYYWGRKASLRFTGQNGFFKIVTHTTNPSDSKIMVIGASPSISHRHIEFAKMLITPPKSTQYLPFHGNHDNSTCLIIQQNTYYHGPVITISSFVDKPVDKEIKAELPVYIAKQIGTILFEWYENHISPEHFNFAPTKQNSVYTSNSLSEIMFKPK